MGGVMARPRIAICGIRHESNTFSTLRTGLDDFHILRGDGILNSRVGPTDDSVEWAPTLVAYAAPHGAVDGDAYAALKAELIERLAAAGSVDGVYLSLHGAMEVEGVGDGETDLVAAIREVTGDVPMAASLDLHANISPQVATWVNVLTAYRTAPHVDGAETRDRAVTHLKRCISEGLRPTTCMAKLPLLLAGEYAVTDVEPAKSLYASLRQIEARPGIMDASIAIGCAWTDSPHASVSPLVVAEGDIDPARWEVERLSDEIWERRREFAPDTKALPLDAAITQALASAERPVMLADSGDNPGAGGGGDSALVLEALLECGARKALVGGIADPAAVAKCAEVAAGEVVAVSVGGKLDAVNGRPVDVAGTIVSVDPGEHAVVQAEGVTLVLTQQRCAIDHVDHYAAMGVDPREYQVVVVKCGYLSPNLRTIAGGSIMALTPGFTDLRLHELPYERIRRPIFPLDDM